MPCPVIDPNLGSGLMEMHTHAAVLGLMHARPASWSSIGSFTFESEHQMQDREPRHGFSQNLDISPFYPVLLFPVVCFHKDTFKFRGVFIYVIDIQYYGKICVSNLLLSSYLLLFHLNVSV
jgi:hypothetical protein